MSFISCWALCGLISTKGNSKLHYDGIDPLVPRDGGQLDEREQKCVQRRGRGMSATVVTDGPSGLVRALKMMHHQKRVRDH
jgi:hypothetical protein